MSPFLRFIAGCALAVLLAAAAPDSLHRANVQRYFTDALPENLVCDRPMISGLR